VDFAEGPEEASPLDAGLYSAAAMVQPGFHLTCSPEPDDNLVALKPISEADQVDFGGTVQGSRKKIRDRAFSFSNFFPRACSIR